MNTLKEKAISNNKQNPQKVFAKLLADYEQDEEYRLDGLKVEIAEKIYLAMKNRHVSNAELARRLNKSRPYITKILQGNVNFTLETLAKIAQALDCEMNFDFNARRQQKIKPNRKSINQKVVNLV